MRAIWFPMIALAVWLLFLTLSLDAQQQTIQNLIRAQSLITSAVPHAPMPPSAAEVYQ